MSKNIHEYILAHREEMIEDLKKLVEIDSTKGAAAPGAPYGEGVAKVFDAAKELISAYGFSCKEYDGHVICADFSEAEKGLDILAHLDVVPAGADWSVTEPFKPLVTEDRIYGRGSADDKGPAVAALYAMRAVKELGYPLKKNVRLILGGDEECGSTDIDYYYALEEEAPMTFSPDAHFPVINIEKALCGYSFSFEGSDEQILEVHAGERFNMIPARATAKVKGILKEEFDFAAKIFENRFPLKAEGTWEADILTITVLGEGGHGSLPEQAHNALTGLLELLRMLPFGKSRLRDAFSAVSLLFPYGEHHGQSLGVDLSDEISGRITVSLNMLHYDGKILKGAFDSRAPICASKENFLDVVEERYRMAGLTPCEAKMIPAHHVPQESPFVQTLLKIYEKVTGEKGYCIAIGGGTYVHSLKNGVAFGCGDINENNNMHGPDEFMMIERLVKSAEIFAEVIAALCCEA